MTKKQYKQGSEAVARPAALQVRIRVRQLLLQLRQRLRGRQRAAQRHAGPHAGRASDQQSHHSPGTLAWALVPRRQSAAAVHEPACWGSGSPPALRGVAAKTVLLACRPCTAAAAWLGWTWRSQHRRTPAACCPSSHQDVVRQVYLQSVPRSSCGSAVSPAQFAVPLARSHWACGCADRLAKDFPRPLCD